MEAVDPGGQRWRVRVLWLPRHRALARRFGGWRRDRRKGRGLDSPLDAVPDGGDDVLFAVAVVVAVVLAVGLFWWVLLPLLLLVVDVLVVVVLLVAGVAARVLLRRPWSVEAARQDGHVVTRSIVGWRAALRERDDLAAAIVHGQVRGSSTSRRPADGR